MVSSLDDCCQRRSRGPPRGRAQISLRAPRVGITYTLLHALSTRDGGDLIDLGSVTVAGAGLARPECVLAHASGRVFASDWTAGGGVAVIEPDGRTWKVLAKDPPEPLRPNGIALLPGGAFLLAHLGAETGGVYELRPDGTVLPRLLAIDGTPLPPTNFVLTDRRGRIWVTVSTRQRPRALGYRADVADGFIALIDGAGARIVADGIGYANECALDAAGDRLFVNETFARRLTAFDVDGQGRLSGRREVARFGAGTYPDGLCLDASGDLWITSIVSNRVIRVGAGGRQETVLQDADPAHVDWCEAAFRDGKLGRPHLDKAAGSRLRNVSSLAFGGSDLRTAYLGCLLGDAIALFSAPVAGMPPAHWDHDISALLGRGPSARP
ncbi:MAG: SMP-30/gluconolactonase/LRE family protein [Alphaproteobacteria bacterium]|nr:SMP-30/gluconolactonase/LRE family protein [Alphaproteobacteria bacterium]